MQPAQCLVNSSAVPCEAERQVLVSILLERCLTASARLITKGCLKILLPCHFCASGWSSSGKCQETGTHESARHDSLKRLIGRCSAEALVVAVLLFCRIGRAGRGCGRLVYRPLGPWMLCHCAWEMPWSAMTHTQLGWRSPLQVVQPHKEISSFGASVLMSSLYVSCLCMQLHLQSMHVLGPVDGTNTT